MKKVMFLLAVGVMCLTACAQKKDGERGPRQGGHMASFDYGYKIAAVRDWLFRQSK